MYKSKSMIAAAVLMSGLALAAGCSESISYAKSSRAEGIRLYEQQNYAEAAGAFRNAVNQQPADYESRYWLGQAYDRLGRHQLAMQAYSSGLEQIGKTIEGRRDVQTRDKLIDAMASSIANAPEGQLDIDRLEARADFDAYVVLAKVCRRLGDADMAIENYSAALNSRPNDFVLAKEYGLYLQQLNQQQRSIVVLKQAYSINPNDPEVNAILTGHGIVLGPGLKPEDKLAKPLMPNGPMPDLREFRDTRYSEKSDAVPAADTAPARGRDLVPYTDEGPRD